ncbi:hypothetical protein [Candidatus Chloroploca asiatica]|uniref:Uncharacterized protein n=1 Tax=Candidatus Chloroploca asiatica TaxID=1506545 RepID=A0A2H3LEY1_9CHLR|nr:hypothetical protein [Candidatus Chloroploca asiatica]PDW01340.1 hypothetical protein A9Q02_21085 [Candidatus Chloroploca asiatica]
MRSVMISVTVMMSIAAYTPIVTGSQNPAVLLTAVCNNTTSQRLPFVRLKNQVKSTARAAEPATGVAVR